MTRKMNPLRCEALLDFPHSIGDLENHLSLMRVFLRYPELAGLPL